MFSNWFSKKKPDVEDLEEITITPEIVIPEPTRRMLYDSAVKEVQQLRVQELIKRELAEMCLSSQALASTKACIEIYGDKKLERDEIWAIRSEYPEAAAALIPGGDGLYRFAIPPATIYNLTHALTLKYLSE
jgi:hypothetical protein